MENIVIKTLGGEGLICALEEQGVSVRTIESKGSTAELSTILIALGGGAGIAAIVGQIGAAFRGYFAGVAEMETARRAVVTIGQTKFEVSAGNLDEVLQKLPAILSVNG